MSHPFKLLIFLSYLLVSSLVFSADGHKELSWKDRNVSVCWANEEVFKQVFAPLIKFSGGDLDDFKIPKMSLESKAKIKNLVNLHYSKEITGIHFSGWETCLPMDRSVKLFYFDRLEFGEGRESLMIKKMITKLTELYLGIASIGSAAFGDTEMNKVGREGSQALILRTLNPGTVLHEFGHLSGLRHEHTKVEVYHGEVCHQYKEIVHKDFDYKNERKNGAITLTTGDDFSIMSYCYIKLWKAMEMVGNFDIRKFIYVPHKEYIVEDKKKYRYRTLLSSSDIHSLRCLYTDENESHYCEYHNANRDKYSQKNYKRYLKRVISNESQSIYEY